MKVEWSENFEAESETSRIDELEFLRRSRRNIHRFPELSHTEHRTADLVERILWRFGLAPFRPAPTSVAVVVGPPGVRPAIGFRADLDALPVLESTGASYASRRAGVSHACGHDGHAAVLLTLARRLACASLERPVLLVWQQGEEADPSGAPLVLAGLPLKLRASQMFAFHLWPELPQGTLGIRPGPLFGSVSGIVIAVAGRSGRSHGSACDDDAIDALDAGAEILRQVRATWTSRHPDLSRRATITIGQMDGGGAPNRPALECNLSGSLRALSWQDEELAVADLRVLVARVAAATGTEVHVNMRVGIRPPVVNDEESVRLVRFAAEQVNTICVPYPPQPVGVTDDFGWFLDGTPGAMVLVGCAIADDYTDLHDPSFDFDEVALVPALDLATSIIQVEGRF